MKNSITKKLFFITVVMFSLFFIGIIIFQNYFFDKLYFETKKKEANEFVEEFYNQSIKNNWDLNRNITKANEWSRDKNVKFYLIDSNYQIVDDYMDKFILVEDDDSNIHRVDLSNLEESKISMLNENDVIEIEYDKELVDKEINFIYPLEIYSIAEGVTIAEPDENIGIIKGNIAYKQNIDTSIQIIDNSVNILYDFLWNVRNTKDTNYFMEEGMEYYKDQITGAINAISNKKINIEGKEYRVIVISSFYAIDEAGNVLVKYYPYLALFALLLIILMAMIYSIFISKPLKRINTAAVKMANMDFSYKLPVNSKDEVGVLSDSLNKMALNLKHNLEELKRVNAKLYEDIEWEKEQEKIRKEFVANVSHELKTPLGVIKGFAEGVKDGINENKKDHYMNVILEEVENMNSLVMEMLLLSKLEDGKSKLNKTEFDILEMIDKALLKLTNKLEDKSLMVDNNLGVDKIIVYADKDKILQVIQNLLTNAIIHSPKEERIKIYLEQKQKTIRFYFENTGVYIEENSLERIWDRFYKIDKARNRKETGTGLGLAIVKNIMLLHKNKYGVENTADGVRFYFELNK